MYVCASCRTGYRYIDVATCLKCTSPVLPEYFKYYESVLDEINEVTKSFGIISAKKLAVVLKNIYDDSLDESIDISVTGVRLVQTLKRYVVNDYLNKKDKTAVRFAIVSLSRIMLKYQFNTIPKKKLLNKCHSVLALAITLELKKAKKRFY